MWFSHASMSKHMITVYKHTGNSDVRYMYSTSKIQSFQYLSFLVN